MTKMRGRILSFAVTAGLILSGVGYEAAQAGNLAYCIMDCSNWQRRCNRGEFAPRYNSIQACVEGMNSCTERCLNQPFSLQQQPGDRRESAARG
jgi:hypothetical protein